MIFAAYLSSSALVFLLVLFKRLFLSKTRTQASATSRQVRIYVFKTVTFVLLGLLTFTILSVWLDLLKFGVVADFNFPQDYIAAGFLGWLTMAVALSGVLSPIFASRKTGS
jgi:hypothetical protein